MTETPNQFWNRQLESIKKRKSMPILEFAKIKIAPKDLNSEGKPMSTVKITRETAKEAIVVLSEQIHDWKRYLNKYGGEEEENNLLPSIEHLQFAIAALEADTIEII